MSEKIKKGMAALDDDALQSVAGGVGDVMVTGSGSFMSNTGTSLNIVVNWYAGVDSYGNNNAVNYMGGGMTTNTLATFTIPNVYGMVSINAVWHFNGTYGGVPIGSIYASGTASV